jgi:D-ornithine 4,5-aminomutase subunit alpha
MSCTERPDDFEARRERLSQLSDAELHDRFWSLVEQIVAPLLDEARTHTSPSIERSVLLRMGFSSIESKDLVEKMGERNLLAHGAGRQILELARRSGIDIRAAGLELLAGRHWDDLPL